MRRGTPLQTEEDAKRIGLDALMTKFGFPTDPIKKQIHKRMEKTGSEFWTIRPLSSELIVS